MERIPNGTTVTMLAVVRAILTRVSTSTPNGNGHERARDGWVFWSTWGGGGGTLSGRSRPAPGPRREASQHCGASAMRVRISCGATGLLRVGRPDVPCW